MSIVWLWCCTALVVFVAVDTAACRSNSTTGTTSTTPGRPAGAIYLRSLNLGPRREGPSWTVPDTQASWPSVHGPSARLALAGEAHSSPAALPVIPMLVALAAARKPAAAMHVLKERTCTDVAGASLKHYAVHEQYSGSDPAQTALSALAASSQAGRPPSPKHYAST